MIFKLNTSSETQQIFEEINASIRLQPFALCKIAISLALRNQAKLELKDFSNNNNGLELNRQTITGEYDDLFKALILMNEEKNINDEEYFPKYLKAYIDKGAKLLYSEFKYSNGKFYQHILSLEKSI